MLLSEVSGDRIFDANRSVICVCSCKAFPVNLQEYFGLNQNGGQPRASTFSAFFFIRLNSTVSIRVHFTFVLKITLNIIFLLNIIA